MFIILPLPLVHEAHDGICQDWPKYFTSNENPRMAFCTQVSLCLVVLLTILCNLVFRIPLKPSKRKNRTPEYLCVWMGIQDQVKIFPEPLDKKYMCFSAGTKLLSKMENK